MKTLSVLKKLRPEVGTDEFAWYLGDETPGGTAYLHVCHSLGACAVLDALRRPASGHRVHGDIIIYIMSP